VGVGDVMWVMSDGVMGDVMWVMGNVGDVMEYSPTGEQY
jgi:hypothetical protein